MSASSLAPIVPTYASLTLQLQKPMQHGDGRRLLTNPTLLGLSIPAELVGRVVCLNRLFFVAGPGCYLTDEQVKEAALRGSVERANRYAKFPARQFHLCQSQAKTLATLWGLVVEHYSITDRAEQLTRQQQRDAAEAGFEQAHLANGNDPRINAPADWIPDYLPGSQNDNTLTDTVCPPGE